MFFQPNMITSPYINLPYYPMTFENNICYFQPPIVPTMDNYSPFENVNINETPFERKPIEPETLNI